jgi:hypothetical protein
MTKATFNTRGWITGAVALWCAIASVFLAGCSASSPRFVTHPVTWPDPVPEDDDEYRFSSAVQAEEKAEDDHAVDVDKVREKLEEEKPASER